MNKTVRLLSCALSVAVLAGTAASCSNYRRGDSVEKADYTIDFNIPAATEAAISVAIPDNEVERKLMNAVIEGFNQKYPRISVTIKPFSLDAYNSTIVTQNSAGLLADVIWTKDSSYYFLISNDVALNLDLFTQQAEAAGIFDYDADFTSDFRAMGLYDGVRYAVPRCIDSVITFYNKDILAAAGVDLDPATTVVKNGWSWDDFLSVCAKVRAYYDDAQNTDFYPLDANLTWEAVSWPVIESFGGVFLNENGEFALTEEIGAEVVSFVKNLTGNRYIPSEGGSKSSFESGTGAMLFQSTSIDHYETTATLQGKFDIVSFPKINEENSKFGMGFAGYSLNKKLTGDQTKLNAASAFMAYMMSYDGQQKMAADGGLTTPSIRADLSASNAEANWHSAYSGFNIEAYYYGGQYKTTYDFLSYASPTFSSALIEAMNTFVGSYAIRENATTAYNYFKGEVEDAFNSVVS